MSRIASSTTQPRATTYIFCYDSGNTNADDGDELWGKDTRDHSPDPTAGGNETVIAVPAFSPSPDGGARGAGNRPRLSSDMRRSNDAIVGGGDCNGSGGGDCADSEAVGSKDAVCVVVHEVLSEDFGLFTWPSSIVLACLIWSRRQEFKSARVIEIGAGTALPGLLAAKLGASVVLTDREDAPWVLENMRGAVAANGEDLGSNCTVAGLSWGNISPAAIKLANEDPLPNFILGADVFYCSEHFDAVLATAYLFLSAPGTRRSISSSGPGCGTSAKGAGVSSDISSSTGEHSISANSHSPSMRCRARLTSDELDVDKASFVGCNMNIVGGTRIREHVSSTVEAKIRLTGDAAGNNLGNDYNDVGNSSGAPETTNSKSSSLGTGRSADIDKHNDRCVFLTAYHERSARRSLRPLLRKWGLKARVLHDAPSRVLPRSLWESGKYDSVALLEIILAV